MRAEPRVATPEPRERGILMTGPNTLKILADPIRKTQTRRIVKFRVTGPNPPLVNGVGILDFHSGAKWVGAHRPGDKRSSGLNLCPYGVVGDRLWVREAWAEMLAADARGGLFEKVFYRADGETPKDHRGAPLRWRPAIHMPREASRLTLEITEVRVQRLQEISEEDAKAEGAVPGSFGEPELSYRAGFQFSWNGLHGAGAWEANPYVWTISFRRLDGR